MKLSIGFLLLIVSFSSSVVHADTQFLMLSSGAKFGALFPCVPQPLSVNSAIGVTNALRCKKENASSVCDFLISEQQLDTQSFAKSGFSFIEEVHKQYAQQMDANYRNKFTSVVMQGALGKRLNYELIRRQEGIDINVKGAWLVSDGRMLRITASCAPENTSFIKNERELFLNSVFVIH